jgi:thiamine-monophosphate kinase
MNSELQVRELGEQALLKRLYKFCPPELVGDDAALLRVADNHCLVVTTDLLVDNVHFSDRTTAAADVGWRAAAANLSDLAAMGASPLGITIGLGLPGELPVAWVEQLYQGIVDCLRPFQTAIVGGDVCRSAVTTVAITAFGQVPTDRAITRSQAKPGDAILVTGVHGASKAGLELLLHPEQGQSLSQADRSRLITAHQRPRPRLDVIEALSFILYPLSFRIAGMDTSDGIADAVLQICRSSNVGAQLQRRQIPLPRGITNWISEEQAIDWALYGGEDFELVLCLPLEMAQALTKHFEEAVIIGEIVEEPIVILHDHLGQYPDEILSFDKGFQHF